MVPIVTSQHDHDRLDRRRFLALAGRRGMQFGIASASLPALLAACNTDGDSGGALTSPTPSPTDTAQAQKLVSDVTDFSLTGDWEGEFGSVTFKLHHGVFDGKDVYFIRTDASDESFADSEGLVFVPKMKVLAAEGPSADAYLIEGGVSDQATVLSTQPGRRDYTPAWRLNRVEWTATPALLKSVDDVKAAREAGTLRVERTDIILNAPVVKWSGGEMPVDDERTQYLGPGQLLEKPDTEAMTVVFKLHECFPGVRYIVTDTALEPMAKGMNVVHSPRLAGSTKAGATGRTNVFMNGVEGSGPMGFQPSVFDSQAGDPAWSPFWDHMTYAWTDGVTPQILRDERSIHRARNDGDLEEFPGTPDTGGKTFVVNCPVPVMAPNTV